MPEAPDPTGQTPDGTVLYDATQMTAVPFPTPLDPDNKLFVPNPGHDVQDQVTESQARNDVINYLNHDGALVDVPWRVHQLQVSFLPAAVLSGLYPVLRASQIEYTSVEPAGPLHALFLQRAPAVDRGRALPARAARRRRPRLPEPPRARGRAVFLLRGATSRPPACDRQRSGGDPVPSARAPRSRPPDGR